MAQFNFPSNPSQGGTYTLGLSRFIFRGSKWKLFSKKYSYKGSAPSNVNNATQIDLSAGSFFNIILDRQTTVSFTNPPSAGFAKKFQVKLSILSDYENINGYDLANASYDNVSFSVNSEETNPQGLFFKPDGTKMYVTGQAGDDVNEYNLGTAWDVSTASYLQNFSVAAQEATPHAVFFKPDGTKMYVTGRAGNDINEYNLGTPWNVSTAAYLQVFSFADQETFCTGIFFKPDGTKLYVVGTIGDDVNEYNLSTPWDVSTASYLQNFSVAGQDTAPFSVFFKPDGTKMFVVGGAGLDVNEYDLSTAWDVSTASYLQNFSVAAQDTSPQEVFFKSDGTKMYVLGNTNDTLYQYTTGSSGNTTPTVTWPESIAWETGSAPTLPETGQADVLEFFTSDGGTTYYGKLKEDNVS